MGRKKLYKSIEEIKKQNIEKSLRYYYKNKEAINKKSMKKYYDNKCKLD